MSNTVQIAATSTGTTAVVLGASIGGLLAARALADTVDRVIVLERDDAPEPGPAAPRRGVPQGRHTHALLAAGQEVLGDWFPGILEDLERAGAPTMRGGSGLWWQNGGYRVMTDLEGSAYAMSRPLLENLVLEHLEQTGNVEVRHGATVEGLCWDDAAGAPSVDGVSVEGERLGAELVVDCTGRSSRFVTELERAGYPAVPTSNIDVGVSYGTKLLRRRPGDLPCDADFALVAPTPPAEVRGAVLLPIEDDRWTLTLVGMHGDTVPTDDAGFLEFARSLPDSPIGDLVADAQHLSRVMSYRYPSSQRRRFERVRRHPVGYLGLGDVQCSFNPIYGQGMSSAALQARELARVVARNGVRSPRLASKVYRSTAKVVDNPWTIAAGADFLHPSTTGDKAPGTDLVNGYVGHVMSATHSSPVVLERMMEVTGLTRSPKDLMRPIFAMRVLAASRRARRAQRSQGLRRPDGTALHVAVRHTAAA
ncbi:MAG: FAD-dependent oxidoreductase [Ilumatobacter sp.]